MSDTSILVLQPLSPGEEPIVVRNFDNSVRDVERWLEARLGSKDACVRLYQNGKVLPPHLPVDYYAVTGEPLLWKAMETFPVFVKDSASRIYNACKVDTVARLQQHIHRVERLPESIELQLTSGKRRRTMHVAQLRRRFIRRLVSEALNLPRAPLW
jgi:hypothetical protein